MIIGDDVELLLIVRMNGKRVFFYVHILGLEYYYIILK